MSSSTSSIMSVREMIDTAFGEPNKNVVDHKMIETILYLLARQLRILERRVEIELYPGAELNKTSLSVSEIKLHATVPKKKGVSKFGRQQKGTTAGKTSMTRKAVNSITGSGGKMPDDDKAGNKKLLEKSTTDKTSTEKSSNKTSTGKTSTDVTYTDKISTDKTSTYKSSSDKTSTDKTSVTKSSTDKSSTTKSSSNKTATMESSIDKTSTIKTRTEILSSSDKTGTDNKSSDKTSSQKTSTEISSSTGKSTTQRPSPDDTMIDKSSLGKTTTKKSSDKSPTAKSTTAAKEYHKLLEEIEEQREMELRVIHQRADSREQRERTPTPMASMESVEVQYEKLLVVERIPSEEIRAQAGRTQKDAIGRTPRISVVTQEDFMKLAMAVRDLQTRFGITSMPDFPENMQLMQELRKGASLTDAMAALQLSARLEAAEKMLGRMMSLVTELASTTPGIDLNRMAEDLETDVIFDAPGSKPQMAQKIKSITSKKQTKDIKSIDGPIDVSFEEDLVEMSSEGVVKPSSSSPPDDDDHEDSNDFITSDELNSAIKEIYNNFVKTVTEITNRSKFNADNALKIANKLEGRLNTSLDLSNRMNDLESLIAEYAEQINILDTGLSSQMTNYQEQLTQMQHDLEAGLEAMAEALASAGGDTAAVAELNKHFTNLQADIETTQMRQKDLGDIQISLSIDLQNLWKQIEILRGTKSDREEVADALRDKAGLEALNGLVSLQQFSAVKGDLEKRIGAAYDKFNSQELVWQKVIDELLRKLGDKADIVQVMSLRDNIQDIVEKLRSKIKSMLDIVGEPKAAAISRKLHRESACLCCSSPAHMGLEESATPMLPAFPATRPPTLGAEDTSKTKGDGDHGICYTGLPIPHPIDPRPHFCHRYCGGSHTRLHNVISRVPPGMIINPAPNEITTAVGTDGKAYRTDETAEIKPCIPCNRPKIESPVVITKEDTVLSDQNTNSNMTPSDFRNSSIANELPQVQKEATTPPLPIEE